MSQFIFNSLKRNNVDEISKSINLLYNTDKPVIICVGSDLVVGDSLGPIVGTKLQKRLEGRAFVYGTLQSPITAKEISIIQAEIKRLHPYSEILVIDAAVGDTSEIGYVKISKTGIKPGLGVGKELPVIGDVSIIGIVSNKEDKNLNFNTRFSLVYTLACDIVNGVEKAIM